MFLYFLRLKKKKDSSHFFCLVVIFLWLCTLNLVSVSVFKCLLVINIVVSRRDTRAPETAGCSMCAVLRLCETAVFIVLSGLLTRHIRQSNITSLSQSPPQLSSCNISVAAAALAQSQHSHDPEHPEHELCEAQSALQLRLDEDSDRISLTVPTDVGSGG